MKKTFIALLALAAISAARADNVQVNIDLQGSENRSATSVSKELFTMDIAKGYGTAPMVNTDGSITLHRGNAMSFLVDNVDPDGNSLLQVILSVDTTDATGAKYIWRSGSEFTTTNAVVVNMADMTIRKISATYTGTAPQESPENTAIEDISATQMIIGPKGIYTLSGVKLSGDPADLAPGIYIIDGVKTYVK